MDLLSYDFEAEIQKREREQQRLLDVQRGCSSATEVARRRHSVVCRHWLRNTCLKGEFCDFMHQYSSENLPVCQQFDRYGFCNEHEQGICPLKHQEPLGKQDMAPCVHYFLGFCPSGPRCKQRHVRGRAEDAPTMLPDWFLQLLISNREVIEPGSAEIEEEIARVEDSCRALVQKSGPGAFGTSEFDRGAFRESHRETRKRNIHGSTATGAEGLGSSVDANGHGRKVRCTDDRVGAPHTPGTDGVRSLDPRARSGVLEIPRPVDRAIDSEARWDPSDFGIAIPPPAPVAGRVRMFIVKSVRIENVYMSVKLNIWATGKANTRKFADSFTSTDHTLLFFSANESGGYQGVCRMASLPNPNLHPRIWGPMSHRLGATFKLQWLRQCAVDFEKLGSLTNPYNENHSIKKSRDGQEVPFELGRTICRKLSTFAAEDLLAGTSLEHPRNVGSNCGPSEESNPHPTDPY